MVNVCEERKGNVKMNEKEKNAMIAKIANAAIADNNKLWEACRLPFRLAVEAIRAQKEFPIVSDEEMIQLSKTMLKCIDRFNTKMERLCNDEDFAKLLKLYLDEEKINLRADEFEKLQRVLLDQVLYPFIDLVINKEGDHYLVNEDGKICLM